MTVRDMVSRGMDLKNIWIMEVGEGEEIQVFYHGYEIRFPYGKAETGQREQIGVPFPVRHFIAAAKHCHILFLNDFLHSPKSKKSIIHPEPVLL